MMQWKMESQRKQYGRALVELGKEHKNLVVLDADLSSSTRTADFAAAFPERFFNCGIAEQNMMDTAAGILGRQPPDPLGILPATVTAQHPARPGRRNPPIRL